MARIRTIKPEFPQSESMGRVSRDARLLFIQLWTLCDDSGRTRGNSRMLASLLFPYDDDASSLIDGWIVELDREGCIVRYQADGATYIQVINWLNHQKIDKPSQSKIPPMDDGSRILANPRECSSEDQGKDQGKDIEVSSTKPRSPRFDGFSWLIDHDVKPDVANGWLAVRKLKKQANSEIAFTLAKKEAEKARMSLNDALTVSVQKSWAGFNAKWLDESTTPTETWAANLAAGAV